MRSFLNLYVTAWLRVGQLLAGSLTGWLWLTVLAGNATRDRRTFHEVDPVTKVGLGDLRIAIIKDPDQYEICIVSSETFDKAVANPPWIGPAELKDDEVGSWACVVV